MLNAYKDKEEAITNWRWDDSEISNEICKKIIKLGKGKWKLGGSGEGKNIKEDHRKSDVAWINDQWIYDLIWHYMVIANENSGWKYHIVAAEPVQITRYLTSGYYRWHRDGLGTHNEVFDAPSNKFLYGNTRKLSMTILLNDKFKGGDFEINDTELDKERKMTKGSIIIFPSFMEHRVTPVTKGIRYSLVAWFLGPPFR